MPLTRRSSSKSPLPPAQRHFLPPSHYAAAAGIAYYPNSPAAEHETLALSGSGGTPLQDKVDHYASAFMPVAYPSDVDTTSESSIDSKANSSPEERPPVLARSNQRGRRQSLLNDLPQLEASLLPSLRDTIDRMTRTPSQPDPSSTATSASRLSVPKTSGSIRSRSLSPLLAAVTQPRLQEQPVSNPTTPIPRYQSPAQDQSYHNTSLDTPIHVVNHSDKHTRKSSHHKPSSNSDFVQHGVNGAGNSALPKPARSALKKSSTTSPRVEIGSSHQMTVNTNLRPTTQYARPRSRTVHDFTTSTPSHPTSARHITSSTYSDPKQKKLSQLPSIMHQNQRSMLQSQYSTDGSDSDRRYEIVSNQKLTVANAEVFPSSSESEVERAARTRGRYSEGGTGAPRGTSREETSRVGLGIDVAPHIKKSVAFRAQASEMDVTSRLRKPRSHGAATRAPNKQYVTETKFRHEPNRNMPESPGDHHQRRGALLGVINRLKSEKHERGDEDDFYEVGIAISSSRDFEGESAESVAQQQVQDDDVGYDAESSSEPSILRKHTRARSSNRTTPQPTSSPTLLSANNDSMKGRAALQFHSERPLGPCKTPSLSTQKKDKLGEMSIQTSRSPVIPQAVDAVVAIPAALRRHLVYHGSKNPHGLSPKPPSSDVVDKKTPSGSSIVLPASSKPRDHSQEHATRVDRRADRNLQWCSQESVPDPPRQQTLTHADSDLSSVGSMYWDDESESELSQAAETMFREIGKSQERDERRSYQTSERKLLRSTNSSRAHSPSHATQDRYVQDSTREHRPRSQALAAQSVNVDPVNDPEADTLKTRQTVIEEILQAQESFVKRLQVFIDLFILPIRAQNSKEWIAGVPYEVARLFDWLDDIVVLHKQILGSLKATCDAQRSNVEYVAESIRVFVPRLEVYQPYLIKMADVITLVERHIQDGQDDFGEFVRLQETEAECEGWTVRNFLVEPISLLAKFSDYFMKLLRMTPKNHRDYVSTLSLAHSTNVFIRVMTEVKAREDEYALVQKFASRIQGLSSSARLATRDRRLLYHGVVFMIEDDNCTSTTSNYHPGPGVYNAHTTGSNKVSKVATDSLLVRPEPSNTSGTGQSSIMLNSSKPLVHASPLSGSLTPGGSRGVRPKQTLTPTPGTPKVPLSPARPNDDACIQIQVFIFTDLVLLATPSRADDDSSDWTLLDDIGTVKIFDVKTDETNSNGSQEPLDVISVEVVPIDPHKLNQLLNVEECSIVPLRFIVPRGNDDTDDDKGSDTALSYEERKSRWVSALERCRKCTLCSLSILSRDHDPQVDVECDKQKTVDSLVASGLPMPKSPSMQIRDDVISSAGESGGMMMVHQEREREREERGWWCLRFQQVFREMQRQEVTLAMLV